MTHETLQQQYSFAMQSPTNERHYQQQHVNNSSVEQQYHYVNYNTNSTCANATGSNSNNSERANERYESANTESEAPEEQTPLQVDDQASTSASQQAPASMIESHQAVAALALANQTADQTSWACQFNQHHLSQQSVDQLAYMSQAAYQQHQPVAHQDHHSQQMQPPHHIHQQLAGGQRQEHVQAETALNQYHQQQQQLASENPHNHLIHQAGSNHLQPGRNLVHGLASYHTMADSNAPSVAALYSSYTANKAAMLHHQHHHQHHQQQQHHHASAYQHHQLHQDHQHQHDLSNQQENQGCQQQQSTDQIHQSHLQQFTQETQELGQASGSARQLASCYQHYNHHHNPHQNTTHSLWVHHHSLVAHQPVDQAAVSPNPLVVSSLMHQHQALNNQRSLVNSRSPNGETQLGGELSRSLLLCANTTANKDPQSQPVKYEPKTTKQVEAGKDNQSNLIVGSNASLSSSLTSVTSTRSMSSASSSAPSIPSNSAHNEMPVIRAPGSSLANDDSKQTSKSGKTSAMATKRTSRSGQARATSARNGQVRRRPGRRTITSVANLSVTNEDGLVVSGGGGSDCGADCHQRMSSSLTSGNSSDCNTSNSNNIEEAITYKDADIEHTSTHIIVKNCETGRHVQLTNGELISFAVPKLNKIVSGFPKQAITKLKQRRRTLKNRGYAQNCRHKRLDQKNRLERQNKELGDANHKQACMIADMRQRLAESRHQIDALRMENCRLQEQLRAQQQNISNEVNNNEASSPHGKRNNGQGSHESTIDYSRLPITLKS